MNLLITLRLKIDCLLDDRAASGSRSGLTDIRTSLFGNYCKAKVAHEYGFPHCEMRKRYSSREK
jgi:hypothetical protein